jgi:hypothetical protein
VGAADNGLVTAWRQVPFMPLTAKTDSWHVRLDFLSF